VALGVFLITLACSVAGLASDLYWLDSSELAAAAFTLGVAHPPGHPLAALLGKACTLLPLGPVAFKVGLACALVGALAAVQTARLARHLVRRLAADLAPSAGGGPRGYPELLGAAAGLAFGLSYAAGFQAVRPEVYALSALLVISALLELARFGQSADRRRLYLAGLYAGLALTNHHLLAIAALVPAALVVGLQLALRRRAGGRSGPSPWVSFGRLTAAGALGLSMLVYLPLRAATHPLVDWGAPTTGSRFIWLVTARAFQKAVARGARGDLPGVAAALAGELHLVGALLALAGAYLLLRRRSLRALGLLLLAAALGDAAAPALVGFDPANPDAFGYLSVSVGLLAVLAVTLPAVLCLRLAASAARPTAASTATASAGSGGAMSRGGAGGRAATGVAALLLAGALAGGASDWRRVTLAGRHQAAETFGRFLDRAPPRAVVVTSYFQTLFGLWYLRAVEGRRPDTDLVHRHFLAYPGYRDELVRAHPERAPLLGERDVVAPVLLAEPARVIEYDLDLDPSLWAASDLPVVPESDEPQAMRFATWQRFLSLHRACKLGDQAACSEMYEKWRSAGQP